MPLYEYQCEQCTVRFERIEKASALKDERCPECGGIAHRLIGAPALQFKGSGWYVNDYGKGNGNGSSSEKTDAPSTESSSKPSTEKNTEKKAEKKTDAKVA
jgi:putative FmdB family regulatory protein